MIINVQCSQKSKIFPINNHKYLKNLKVIDSNFQINVLHVFKAVKLWTAVNKKPADMC